MYKFKGKLTEVSEVDKTFHGRDKCKVVVCDDKNCVTFQLVGKYNWIAEVLSAVELGMVVEVKFQIRGAKFNDNRYNVLEVVSLQPVAESGQKKRKAGSTYKTPQYTDWFKGCMTKDQAKKRYRELCKKMHPDTGYKGEELKEVNSQYERWK